MADKNTNDLREQQMARQIWLEYFNSYLYERGLITERERNRMVSEILSDQRQRQRSTSKTHKTSSDYDLDR